MKKTAGIVLAACLVLAMFTGCETNPDSKALVVVNESDYAVDYITIREYVSGTKAVDPGSNALAEDETIAPGGQKTFYIAPYSRQVSLYIESDTEYASMYFTFDYKVEGRNEPIEARYDGSTIVLSGSNAEEMPVL